MKTTTFKERFIKFCRNKKVQITFSIIFWIFFIITMLSAFNIIFKSIPSSFTLLSIVVVLYIFKNTIICVISKEEDDFLNNNKLLNIILANENIWNCIIYIPLFFILVIILSLFNINIIIQRIILVIIMIGTYILSLKLANIISKKFRDKLVYKTDSNL